MLLVEDLHVLTFPFPGFFDMIIFFHLADIPALCPFFVPFFISPFEVVGFPGGSGVKMHLQGSRPRLDPWVRKIPWRREWQPTPVFLPGEFQGQRL